MAEPFNQEVSCDAGFKPYRDSTMSGTWSAIFDGSTLTLRNLNGGEALGGMFDGNAVRENYSSAALLRQQQGGPNGTVYFTKSLTGEVINAGHNQKGAGASSDTVVECGGESQDQWADPAPDNPFRFEGGTLTWVPGIATLNCAQRDAGGNFGAITSSNVIASDAGGRLELTNGSATLLQLQSASDPNRTNSVVSDSPMLAPGGQRVWQSVGASNTVLINVRYDNLVRQIQVSQNDVTTYCTPFPTDPRF